MRSSIAMILGAAVACIVSAAPSYAGGTQICRPTGTSPILYTCDSGGFENSVAYSSANYSPSPPAKGGDNCYSVSAARSGAAGTAGAGDGAAAAGAAAASAAGPSG